MNTKLNHGSELCDKILEGVNTLADYVSATLGPKGRNVLIHRKGQQPYITKDGVTVAQNVAFDDPFMNAGAEVVKQASAQTNIEAGDGTTTSTVLTREILKSSFSYINTGTNPIDIKRGLDECLKVALEEIKEMAKPISSEDDIRHIATISANNDAVIGEIVSTAVTRVGKNGSVTVEEARSLETSLDLVEGFKFNSGYVAGAFVTDERRNLVQYEEPLFFVTDSKIEYVNDILPVLEIAARENRPLVIVADDIEGQALAALIVNTVRGSMKVAAVKAPEYGEERRDIMSDLALSIGAKYFRKSEGDSIQDVKLTDFGSANSVEITKRTTTIVDGSGNQDEVSNRIESVKEEIKNTSDINEATRLQQRVTRLASGIAIIKVGAPTQVEVTEKKHRIEDALEAVRSAQAGGIVPGGGTTLLSVSENLAVNFQDEQHVVALSIFKKALSAPFRAMASNAGMSPDVTMWCLQSTGKPFEGYNFTNGTRVNLLDEGIIDPAKVTACALKNAVSVAGTLLLTNHSIVSE